MFKHVFFLSTLLFLTCSCSSKQNKEDIVREIKILHKKAFKNKDSTLIKLNRVRQIITNNTFLGDSIKKRNNYLLGHYFKKNNQNDSADFFFNKTVDLIKDTIKDNDYKYLYNYWSYYLQQGKYGDCFAFLEKYKSIMSASYYHYLMENTHKANNNYKKALIHNKLQIVALKKENNSVNSINEILLIQSQYEFELKNKQRAYFILDSLIQLKDVLNNNTKHNLYRNYGVQKFYEKKYHEAVYNFKEGLHNLVKTPKSPLKKNEIAGLYKNIAESYILSKEYKKAKKHLDSALTLIDHGIKSTTVKSILQTQLYYSYVTDKNIEAVDLSFDNLFKYQNKEYTKKIEKELIALKKASEREKRIIAEKNELEVKNLKRLFILLTIIALLIIVGYLFYKQRKYNFEKHNLQMQQRLLRLQMNPHFTFNTLYAIQNKIEETPKLATKYLLKFSRLLRLILENSTENYILLQDEIEALHKYIELQQLRFPNTFKFQVSLTNLHEDDFIYIPPMLIQPFIENSIEHGIMGMQNKLGEIHLKMTLKEKTIACSIDDNGNGSKTDKKNTRISSTQLINNYLKKTVNKGVEIKNKTHTNGVIVTFEIPYKLSEND